LNSQISGSDVVDIGVVVARHGLRRGHLNSQIPWSDLMDIGVVVARHGLCCFISVFHVATATIGLAPATIMCINNISFSTKHLGHAEGFEDSFSNYFAWVELLCKGLADILQSECR